MLIASHQDTGGGSFPNFWMTQLFRPLTLLNYILLKLRYLMVIVELWWLNFFESKVAELILKMLKSGWKSLVQRVMLTVDVSLR